MSKDLVNVIKFFHSEPVNRFRNGEITIDLIYKYHDYELEADHSFIQWVFPTLRASAFNSNAPVLTLKDIEILRNDQVVVRWLQLFKEKMFEYWGINPIDFNKARLLNGHNGLRLSRAIECLTLFGIEVIDDFSTIQKMINDRIVSPYCEVYEGKLLPIWFIRYKESSEKLLK